MGFKNNKVLKEDFYTVVSSKEETNKFLTVLHALEGARRAPSNQGFIAGSEDSIFAKALEKAADESKKETEEVKETKSETPEATEKTENISEATKVNEDETEEVPFQKAGPFDPETVNRPGEGRVALVDLHNYLHKIFYGAKPTVANCVSILLKTLSKRGYSKIVFASDSSSSARKIFYPGYKSTKEEKPEELKDFLRDVTIILEKATEFSTFMQVEGYEADDIIAAYAKQLPEDSLIDIITTDKDLYQLISERVRIVDILGKETYTDQMREKIVDKIGTGPESIKLLLSIAGDTADSIPGVKGVGKDSAAKLIAVSGKTEYKEFMEWLEGLDMESKDLPVQKRFINAIINDNKEGEHRELKEYSNLNLSWLLTGLKSKLTINLEIPSFSENREEMSKFL
jgi:5'-3' exonuclease